MTSRILNQNFLDTSVLASSYISSEQAAFPEENLYNASRRSKVWRSNGFWKIESGSNTIVFRETPAVDLTANINVGEYNSSDDFFAAVTVALEDVGASTYAVAFDTTTGRIKISSNLGGGGGIFQIIWTSATDMADVLGYDSTTNDTGASNYVADVLRIATEEWITWDFGISSNPEAFVMIGKRNDPIKITPSSVIKLQGNETNNWSDPSYETTLTYDDRVISVFRADSDEGLHTESLRYWRVSIVDTENSNAYIEIGSIFLGTFFEPDRGAIQIPFNGYYIDRSETVFSEGGQTFTDSRQKSERFSIEWFGLTVSEKEEIDAIWDQYGTSLPFFVSFDPSAVMASTGNLYVRFVKFMNEPNYTLVSPGVFRCSMEIREEL